MLYIYMKRYTDVHCLYVFRCNFIMCSYDLIKHWFVSPKFLKKSVDSSPVKYFIKQCYMLHVLSADIRKMTPDTAFSPLFCPQTALPSKSRFPRVCKQPVCPRKSSDQTSEISSLVNNGLFLQITSNFPISFSILCNKC